jgi:hypothetical protein
MNEKIATEIISIKEKISKKLKLAKNEQVTVHIRPISPKKPLKVTKKTKLPPKMKYEVYVTKNNKDEIIFLEVAYKKDFATFITESTILKALNSYSKGLDSIDSDHMMAFTYCK